MTPDEAQAREIADIVPKHCEGCYADQVAAILEALAAARAENATKAKLYDDIAKWLPHWQERALQAEQERDALRAKLDQLQPGTPERIFVSLMNMAEKYGASPFSANHIVAQLKEMLKERDALRALLSEIRLLCDNSDVHDVVRHRVAILAKEQSA